jgi:hypothetical protein
VSLLRSSSSLLLVPSLLPGTSGSLPQLRILVYGQSLESHRSLMLESLRGAVGISVEFVDR